MPGIGAGAATGAGLGSFAGPIGSIGGALIGGLFGAFGSNKANKDDWARQKWLLNYNTPLNQRKRLEEAGLNPALMYGGAGASSAGNASGSAPPVRPVNIAGGVPQALEAFVQYVMMDKRLQLMDADIAQKSQNVVTQQSQVRLNRFNLEENLPSQVFARNRDTSRRDSIFPTQLQAAELQNVGTDLDNTRKQIENSNLPIAQKQALKESAARISEITSRIALNATSAELNRARTEIERIGIELEKKGIPRNSPWYVRIVDKAVEAAKQFIPQPNRSKAGMRSNYLPW